MKTRSLKISHSRASNKKSRNRTYRFRKEEALLVDFFVRAKTPGFAYLRGRRRVGKSTLLKNLHLPEHSVFYFMGRKDEEYQKTLLRMSRDWAEFSQNSKILDFRADRLTWDTIFAEMTQYASSKELCVCFDEVQWIAKGETGFIGGLKEAWLDWEPLRTVKVIICGSSNKFFSDHVVGDEKILRGLKTQADVWVKPFSLEEVKRHYFKEMSATEVAMIYMLVGGIPYYLEQFHKDKNYIQNIEDSILSKNSIFWEEVDEILNLEFNKKSIENVKSIVKACGPEGTEQKHLAQRTGLSDSTISDLLKKLIEYRIVFEKYPFSKKPIKNNQGVRYFVKDFFLNTYFQILSPIEKQARSEDHFLLSSLTQDKSKTHFANFTGFAFERLVRYCLENEYKRNAPIFKKMRLVNFNYDVSNYWDDHIEPDLVVYHHEDKMLRVVECKWTSSQKIVQEGILQVSEYATKMKSKFASTKPYLITQCKASRVTKGLADKNQVVLLGLEDLFFI